MEVMISVTRQDIRDAAAYDGHDNAVNCPIAIASRRALGRPVYVASDCLHDSRFNVIAELSAEAQSLAAEYDRRTPAARRRLKPIIFGIRLKRETSFESRT